MARKSKTTRRTFCGECGHELGLTEHYPNVDGATLARATASASARMEVDIATAGIGIPATIPVTIFGGYTGMKGAKLTIVYPNCEKRQPW